MINESSPWISSQYAQYAYSFPSHSLSAWVYSLTALERPRIPALLPAAKLWVSLFLRAPALLEQVDIRSEQSPLKPSRVFIRQKLVLELTRREA